MAGLQIVNRNNKGKIKQDYLVERTKKGRVVEVNKLKKKEAKKKK